MAIKSYRMKVGVHVTHPTMSAAEVAQYEADTLIVLGHARIAATLASDFRDITIGSKSNGLNVLNDGTWELYPKVWFKAELKQNRDLFVALQAVLDDWDAALTARLTADGFTITLKRAHF